jgi:acyl-CoA thioester hydrolase
MPHKNYRLVHTEIIPIRWGDMDAMGHVNNTIFFRYMESARIAWFERIGVRAGPEQVGPVLINASCTFLKQLVYPGEVEVKVFAGGAGRTSLQTWIEMRPSYDADTIYAEGSGKVVWVDFPKNKSVPLPDGIRKLVEA